MSLPCYTTKEHYSSFLSGRDKKVAIIILQSIFIFYLTGQFQGTEDSGESMHGCSVFKENLPGMYHKVALLHT